MTDYNNRRAGIAKHSTYLTIEDTADGSPWLSLYIYAFFIKRHMTFHIRDRIRAKTMDNTITSDDRHGKSPTVAFKTATELTVN